MSVAKRVLPFDLDRISPYAHGLEEFLEELAARLQRLELKNRQLGEQNTELSMALQETSERLARIELLLREAPEAEAPELPRESRNELSSMPGTLEVPAPERTVLSIPAEEGDGGPAVSAIPGWKVETADPLSGTEPGVGPHLVEVVRATAETDFVAPRSPWRVDSLELVASPFRNFAALVAFHSRMQRLAQVHVQGFRAGKLQLSLHFPRPVPLADPLMELSQLPVRLVSLDESRIEVEICGSDGLDP